MILLLYQSPPPCMGSQTMTLTHLSSSPNPITNRALGLGMAFSVLHFGKMPQSHPRVMSYIPPLASDALSCHFYSTRLDQSMKSIIDNNQ